MGYIIGGYVVLALAGVWFLVRACRKAAWMDPNAHD